MLKILFLCTGNSCRSQMAEGWARRLKAGRIEAYSAGIESRGLDPDAVRVMAEAGVDISGQRSKRVGELRGIDFDYVVTVCGDAHESCPVFPGKAKDRRDNKCRNTEGDSPIFVERKLGQSPTCSFAGPKVVHVGFDDPPRLAAGAKTEDERLASYRRVRDEIRAMVETLPDCLERQQQQENT